MPFYFRKECPLNSGYLSVLIAITGLKPGTILRARKECWMVGREYIHVSPDGNPKPSSECMYNRKAIDAWVASMKNKQPR
ncbi:excisionase family protein [Escherichia coli]|uniref:excisionase family protein n=1 Tax=Escherichia coli TaxID=562 RepID=UPI0018D6D9DB|nr:excisionase family protein [Escherichia coli]QPR15327.1 excisionase family protein [Escherichia coli]